MSCSGAKSVPGIDPSLALRRQEEHLGHIRFDSYSAHTGFRKKVFCRSYFLGCLSKGHSIPAGQITCSWPGSFSGEAHKKKCKSLRLTPGQTQKVIARASGEEAEGASNGPQLSQEWIRAVRVLQHQAEESRRPGERSVRLFQINVRRRGLMF